jgi:putative SOS response-associated peptidase YedK
MCARLTLTTTAAEIADLFGLAHDTRQFAPAPAPVAPRYNVAPSALIPVVRVANGARELAELRWGLVPHWSTDPKPAGFVNARAETAPQKPAFRDPFKYRRCLVPADGFFEWKTVGKKKYPYFVRRAGGGLFVYAGLWDRWHGPDGPVDTVAVLTVPANDLIRPLHDRMPAILDEGRFAAWLDPKETRPAKLLPLLTPCPAERMEMWPVGETVNRAAADGAGLLAPVAEPPKPTRTQPGLFDDAA